MPVASASILILNFDYVTLLLTYWYEEVSSDILLKTEQIAARMENISMVSAEA